MGMARLDVSVIVEVPTHGDAGEVGVGTVISGLRPPLTSVVLSGVVPSVNTGPVLVLDPGRVEAVLLTEEVATGAVGVGLQMPDMFDVPNGDVTGSGATEEGGEDGNPGIPVVLLELTTIVVAVLVAELVIPAV